MSESTGTKSAHEREEDQKPPADAAAQADAAGGEQTAAPGAEGNAPAAEPQPETDAALAELRQQLDRANAARDASLAAQRNAEAEAAQLRQRVQQGEISVRQAQIIAVSRAFDAQQAEISSLRDQYAGALSGGDYAKAAELQAAMSEAAAKKVQLGAAKDQLERMPEPSLVQPQSQAQSDPAEAALRNYTPRTQDWLRRHPEILRDQARMDLAISAHYAAKAAGHVHESDSYFDHIDRMMGFKADPAAQTGNGKRPVPAAAPSRNGGGANGHNGSIQIRDMTPRMHQLAKEADMKPEEWLRNYNDLVSEGKIERIH